MLNKAVSGFNSSPSTWLHIDLNSCFATIEQQANPHLRGKPIAVCAYTTPRGCILAPSIEAKRFGIKTGMQVREGKSLCPHLIVLPSDPPKYRFVNRALLKLLNEYTPDVSVRSIDEMLLHFDKIFLPPIGKKQTGDAREGSQTELYTVDPARIGGYYTRSLGHVRGRTRLEEIAREIKTRITSEIGEWLTVSVGIAPNPYLAKLAAGLHKPDGLDEITASNILNILSNLHLVDLPYIKERNQTRLNRVGIKTPVEFYFATKQQLKSAFESIQGHYWYLRLHGHAIDEIEWQRKSIGHQYALPKRTQNREEIEQLLCKLVEKVGHRLRENDLTAHGLHLALGLEQGYFNRGHKFSHLLYTNQDIFHASKQLLQEALPLSPVRLLAVTCFALEKNLYTQTTLFHNELKKRALTQALDRINNKWGEFSVIPGTMLSIHKERKILDRIAFGGVMDMPDVVLKQTTNWEREKFID